MPAQAGLQNPAFFFAYFYYILLHFTLLYFILLYFTSFYIILLKELIEMVKWKSVTDSFAGM